MSEGVIELHGNLQILIEKWTLVNNSIETHMSNKVDLGCAQADRDKCIWYSFCKGFCLACPL